LMGLLDLTWNKQISAKELDQLERQWTEQLLRGEAERRLLQQIVNSDPEALRRKINDDRSMVRLAAVQVIAGRRFHLEGDLIGRLGDPSNGVAQAARQSLVRLARGTDFGPPPKAKKSARDRSIALWKSWLDLQRAAEARPAADADLRVAIDRVLGRHTNVLVAVDPEVVRLRDELLRAKGDAQEEVLQRLRDEKGVVHTEALVQAIPQLADDLRAKARDALVERMTRMTAQTLRDKFAQEDVEVRRAAALACASKGDTDMIPDLIDLLGDSETTVAQAARASLKKLAGKDFGPGPDALPGEQARAVTAWNEWMEKQGAKQ
jgi:hypothetical protein